ncbi:MAG TPA: hypothetical protein VEB21_06470, partial [Terriglobales bacterium]|nr:hypothetical protein [Terriglobales bacterium]
MIEIGRLLAFVALCLVNWAPTESLAQDDGAALLLYPYVRVDTARNIDTTIQMSDISMLGNGSEVLADCYYLSSDRHCDRSGAICATDAQCAAAESCDATFVAERFPLRFFLSAPVTWSAAQGGTPVVLPANPIPAVPEDPFTGSLICVRYGSALNLLQGEATIGRYDAVDGALDIAKYNAVGLPAAPSAEGGDDTLVLGGAMEEYGNCGFSNTVQHLFDGADSLTTPGRQVFTTLALLPCEVDFVAESFASGTVNYTVTDELEQQYSLTEPLALPLARRLSDIDPSIFSFAMIGSLTGQTSIQSDTVGFAVVAIQEEVDPNSPSVAHSAALDTHRRGFKFEEDRIRLGEPGAEPTLTATATLTSTSVPTATLPPTASPTSTPTPVVVCGNGVIE